MDELAEIREQIARHTDEQRTAWLQQLRSRYSAWMFIAGLSAILVMVAAALARSAFFGVAAVFLCLFAWNRRMECDRVERWLSRATPQNQQERVIWARIFYDEMSRSSLWLKITEWISGIAAVALIATVSLVVFTTGVLWTRLLYGFFYVIVALVAIVWLLARRKFKRELKAQIALSGQRWSELT
jgi:hypothetical protein